MLYSGSLAHEMRSHLATILMLNQMLYSILQNKHLQPDEIKKILKSSKMIEEKCVKGLDSIDTILNIIRTDFISDTELQESNIMEVVESAIKLCNLPDDVKVSIDKKYFQLSWFG